VIPCIESDYTLLRIGIFFVKNVLSITRQIILIIFMEGLGSFRILLLKKRIYQGQNTVNVHMS
jgi:hypothetical protein